MADVKISQLTNATTPLAGTELVPVVQSGVTKQTTANAIMTGTVPSGTANGVMYLNGSKVASTSNGLVFDSSGNLGLGAVPSAWSGGNVVFQIGGSSHVTSSGSAITIGNNYRYSGGNFYVNAGAASQYFQTGGAHYWQIAPSGTAGNAISFTQAMTLDASGALLVGKTASNPAVVGIESAGYGLFTATRDGGFPGYFNRLTSDGSVISINKDSAQVGSISVSGSTTSYNTSSDARLKENITPASDSADLIDAIQVRQYDWKSDGSHQRYGMVAQELDQVFPEAVSKPTDPEEMMGVDYSKLVPLLLKEIQSLRARVAALEAN
jgi:hypothetical protein